MFEDSFCNIQDQATIENIAKAELSLDPIAKPWMHFDLALSINELELLQSITINTNPPFIDCLHFRYDNFAKFEELLPNLTREIKTYSLHHENDHLADFAAQLITKLANNILAAAKFSQALIVIKAHKNIDDDNFDDSYSWHRDATLKQRMDIAPSRLSGKISASNYSHLLPLNLNYYQGIIETNYIITLKGPSTLFYSPQVGISNSSIGKGTVYIADYDYGTIHTAPKVKNINTARLFMIISPNEKEIIEEFSKLY